MNSMKQKRLSRKLLLSLVLFALMIMLFASLLVGIQNYQTEMFKCAESAYAYARAAAQFIDGDRVLGYLEPVGVDADGEPIYATDAYYDEIMSYLVSAQTEYALMKYYYVFVPYEDDLIYVWDAISAEDYCPLGWVEDYMDGGKEAVDQIYCRNPVEEITVFQDETYGHIACAYYPIYDSTGAPVAVVGVDLSMERIEREVTRSVLLVIVSVFAVTLLAVTISFFLIRRTLIRPIQRLNTAAKNMVENLDRSKKFELEIHTRDELEELARSFGKMNDDLRDYLTRLARVTAEKERIGAELSIATQIQADMLPRIFPAFPERPEFGLFASMDPAKEVGGDFYDFFLVDDSHLALVMADVSGKGVPAALFMVIAKTLLKNRLLMGDSPAQALKNVNEQLCEGNDAELFVTVWLAVLDLTTGTGLAANAGHEHPALRRAGGQYELVIYRHSPAVATMEGIRFREHAFELHPGDSLFVYTDGVPEATNANDELFGSERMVEALNHNVNAAPAELLAAVRSELDAFVGEAPQFDDVTMLCLDYFGPDGNVPASQNEEDEIKKAGFGGIAMEELTVEARSEALDRVLAFVDAQLEALDCPMKAQMQLDVAVEELFINICSYAYAPGSGSATIRFQALQEPRAAEITFVDSGVPYDPLNKPDPDVTLSADERPIGGLGIYMVKKTMDEVRYRYENGQNILTIVKHL